MLAAIAAPAAAASNVPAAGLTPANSGAAFSLGGSELNEAPVAANAMDTTAAKPQASKTDETDQVSPDGTPGSSLAWLLSALNSALSPAAAGSLDSVGLTAQTGLRSESLAPHGPGTAQRAARSAAEGTGPSPQTDDEDTEAEGEAEVSQDAQSYSAASAMSPAPMKLAAEPSLAVATAGDRGQQGIAPPSAAASGVSLDPQFRPLLPVLPSSASADAAPGAVSQHGMKASLDLNQEGWPTSLVEHVQWQVLGGVQEARLELNPRELGNLQIHVQISGNEAQVQFAAVHPRIREMLSAGMPQLRSMLAEGGMHLSQAQVGGQGQSPQQPRNPGSASTMDGHPAQEEEMQPQLLPTIVRIGLVDDFA